MRWCTHTSLSWATISTTCCATAHQLPTPAETYIALPAPPRWPVWQSAHLHIPHWHVHLFTSGTTTFPAPCLQRRPCTTNTCVQTQCVATSKQHIGPTCFTHQRSRRLASAAWYCNASAGVATNQLTSSVLAAAVAPWVANQCSTSACGHHLEPIDGGHSHTRAKAFPPPSQAYTAACCPCNLHASQIEM